MTIARRMGGLVGDGHRISEQRQRVSADRGRRGGARAGWPLPRRTSAPTCGHHLDPDARVDHVVQFAAPRAKRDGGAPDVLRAEGRHVAAPRCRDVMSIGRRRQAIVVDRSRGDRRPETRRSPRTSPAPHRTRAPPGRASPRPLRRAPGRPRSASAPRAARTAPRDRAGRLPFSVSRHSITSSELPTIRPSGAFMSVMSASVRTPDPTPIATSDFASRRESSSVFMNAPPPVFTSSTRPPIPSAIFLLMIDAQMSGMLSTVPVTSRRA